jgi:hypothetical protein
MGGRVHGVRRVQARAWGVNHRRDEENRRAAGGSWWVARKNWRVAGKQRVAGDEPSAAPWLEAYEDVPVPAMYPLCPEAALVLSREPGTELQPAHPQPPLTARAAAPAALP